MEVGRVRVGIRSQKSGNWQLGRQQDWNSGLSLDPFKCRSKDQTAQTSQSLGPCLKKMAELSAMAWRNLEGYARSPIVLRRYRLCE